MADASSKQSTPTETTPMQVYFVPELNISVEASSLDEAITKAKKLKGVK